MFVSCLMWVIGEKFVLLTTDPSLQSILFLQTGSLTGPGTLRLASMHQESCLPLSSSAMLFM